MQQDIVIHAVLANRQDVDDDDELDPSADHAPHVRLEVKLGPYSVDLTILRVDGSASASAYLEYDEGGIKLVWNTDTDEENARVETLIENVSLLAT